jgi:hypothetical protein
MLFLTVYFETGMSTDATNIDFEIDHASKHQNRTWKVRKFYCTKNILTEKKLVS